MSAVPLLVFPCVHETKLSHILCFTLERQDLVQAVTLASNLVFMCVDIKYIFTRSRFISLHHDERLLVPVKCGKCYECMQQKRDEWYYRIYYEWLSTLSSDCNNPYVFFDTLTYSGEFLPHISEFFNIKFPKKLDFPCFCYEDLRYFFVRLRRNLSYLGYDVSDSLRYFVSSEYGTADEYVDDNGYVRVATHRPHYHVLFFVTCDNLSVATLRHAIDDAWFFGRTDRVRYYGTHANYFRRGNHGDINTRSVSSYVAKYVQKSSLFQSQIDYRLTEIVKYLYQSNYCYADVTHTVINIDNEGFRYLPSNLAVTFRMRYDYGFYSFVKSANGAKLLRDCSRLVSQFHRQSKGFGEYALHDMDIKSVMETGHVIIPDSLSVQKVLSVPLYYERKIFYEQIEVDGHRMWQLNSLGKIYKRMKENRAERYLSDKISCVARLFDYKLCYSPSVLAHYCVFERFRNNGSVRAIPTILDKLSYPDIVYNYSCPSDRMIFHEALISKEYVGMSGNYYSHCCDYSIPIRYFLSKHMKIIPEYESELHEIGKLLHRLSDDVQSRYDYIIASRNRKHAAEFSLF